MILMFERFAKEEWRRLYMFSGIVRPWRAYGLESCLEGSGMNSSISPYWNGYMKIWMSKWLWKVVLGLLYLQCRCGGDGSGVAVISLVTMGYVGIESNLCDCSQH